MIELVNHSDGQMRIDFPANTPSALLNWVKQAYSDRVEIAELQSPYDCQGVQALPGDWMVEFDGQLGVLFRRDGATLRTVTRNDGEAPESIALLPSDLAA